MQRLKKPRFNLERVGMLGLVPGLEFAIESLEEFTTQLKQELDAIYAQLSQKRELPEPEQEKPPMSPETRRRMSDAAKKRVARQRAAKPQVKMAAPGKAKKPYVRPPKGVNDPPQIDGWWTKTGAGQELGVSQTWIEKRMANGNLRRKVVPAPPGSRNNVRRVVLHPDDVTRLKATLTIQPN